MQLAIELDNVLVNVKATEDAWAGPWFDDDCDEDERAVLPDMVHRMWATAVPHRKVLGWLMRAAIADPRLEVKVLSDRPERFQQDTKEWLRTWMPANVRFELFNTSDFSLIPAQAYRVVSEVQVEKIEAKGGRVVESFDGLGLVPDRALALKDAS